MQKNNASHLLMIRPANFGYNNETIHSNVFQNEISFSRETIKSKALKEFDAFVEKLRSVGIVVHVFDDTEIPIKPDAIFPNNWISFHQNGTVVLYPMEAKNRQTEIRRDILVSLKQRFIINQIIDYSQEVENNSYLEGTGSMVIDYKHQVSFACKSSRTDTLLFEKCCKELKLKPFLFTATDENNIPFYHTNVIMCIGSGYVIAYINGIKDEKERLKFQSYFNQRNIEIIPIDIEQVTSFAGNMLELNDKNGNPVLIMSSSAYGSLNTQQVTRIDSYAETLVVSIPTIETVGGGSARCMMAEILLPEK